MVGLRCSLEFWRFVLQKKKQERTTGVLGYLLCKFEVNTQIVPQRYTITPTNCGVTQNKKCSKRKRGRFITDAFLPTNSPLLPNTSHCKGLLIYRRLTRIPTTNLAAQNGHFILGRWDGRRSTIVPIQICPHIPIDFYTNHRPVLHRFGTMNFSYRWTDRYWSNR